MGNLVCPYCDTELTDEAKFCPICGEDVTEYIRKIKIDRQSQMSATENGVQKKAVISEGNTDGKKRMLTRFLTAFGVTLVISIMGIVALLVGGLV